MGQEILDFLLLAEIIRSKLISKQFKIWSDSLLTRESESERYYLWDMSDNLKNKNKKNFKNKPLYKHKRNKY